MDTEAFTRTLGNPWVPDQLISLVTSVRKGGVPWKTFRTLAQHGYIERNADHNAWQRTPKHYPQIIVGEKPNTIPGGAITRLVRLWNDGRRDLTKDDFEEARTDSSSVSQRAVIKQRA